MNEKFKELLKLVEKNPDLPILCMVAGDVVGDDYYDCWMAQIRAAVVGEFTYYNDRYYDDQQAFIEAYYDNNEEILYDHFGYDPRIAWDVGPGSSYTPEEMAANVEAEKRMDAYLDKVADRAFTKAILVYIDTPDDYLDEFEDEKEIKEEDCNDER